MLAPASVTVIDDDKQLAEALVARGLTVNASDHPGPALAVIEVRPPQLHEVLDKLDSEVRQVLLWHVGDVPVAEWVAVAAEAACFRSETVLPDLRDLTCLLLDAVPLTLSDVVARYERIVEGTPEVAEQLRTLRHHSLTARDHAIGTEAEVARLKQELTMRTDALYSSATWRLGNRMAKPLRLVKRALRK